MHVFKKALYSENEDMRVLNSLKQINSILKGSFVYLVLDKIELYILEFNSWVSPQVFLISKYKPSKRSTNGFL